ncbi:hypothetical protein M758_1G072900 [Ceratodon purpureus]|nr:hypothetical protein M758_1G072900 [Ceratodon purpureus]
MAAHRCCTIVTLLGLLFFFSLILAQGAAAAASEVEVEGGGLHLDELNRLLAPDADHLAASESNLQRWLAHVRLTSSIPYTYVGSNSPNASSSLASEDKHVALTVLNTRFNNSKHLESARGSSSNRKSHRVCTKNVIYVEKDGSGNFTTVQAAINSLPRRNKCRVDIQIGVGVFREKVMIKRSRPHVTLKGSSQGSTIIVYNDTASSRDKHGRLLGTIHSASVSINSNYFIAKNITFMNTAPAQKPGAVRQQAVALRISGDKAAFFDCKFYAHQDTLYDHRGRHYFKNCYITGTVDFIFGYGRSFYEGAELVALPDFGNPGSITAQKRNETTLDTGFSFVNSRITGAGMVYLGRAWGNDSRVVFANTYMDDIVVPEGWGDWGIPARQKTVFYAQFNCTGPGADT